MQKYSFIKAFESRKDLAQYGDSNALCLFALELILGAQDPSGESVVDGPEDCGIDLVYIDRDSRCAVISQNYYAISKDRTSPESSKVSSLSHGLTMLFREPIVNVPLRMKSTAEEIRNLISKNKIDTIQIWFTHNLRSSKNVKKELARCERTAEALLSGSSVTEIKSLEVSSDEIEDKWRSLTTPILIDDSFTIPCDQGIRVKSSKWDSYVTLVSLTWLHDQYKRYGLKLFSSNVRDYLGTINKDKNINNAIKLTAQKQPEDFWVFNNGITALVNEFKIDETSDKLNFNGLSILNGAQTTGAIGNLSAMPPPLAKVQIRIVKCKDRQTVNDIKRFNNSQNKIDSPDFKSNDSVQKRLVVEFESLDVSYMPRRGGVEDMVKRKPNTLTSILTGQIIAAFHSRPDIAYHKKTAIWEEESMYNNFFSPQLTAKHVFLVYSLYTAIRKKKLALIKRSKISDLTDTELEQLEFYQSRGSIFLMIYAVSKCLQIFVKQPITDFNKVEFKVNLNFKLAVEQWEKIIDILSSLTPELMIGFSNGAIKEKNASEATTKFTRSIDSISKVDPRFYYDFVKQIKY